VDVVLLIHCHGQFCVSYLKCLASSIPGYVPLNNKGPWAILMIKMAVQMHGFK